MKKLVLLASVSALLCSCGGGFSDRPLGVIYSDVSDPVTATTVGGSRVGTATAVTKGKWLKRVERG